MAYRLLGAAHKVVPISENRRKTFKVIHGLGNRLNGGQCQNKIGGEHLYHVGIAMHGFCWALHAKWYPSVRIDEEHPSKKRPRKEVIWR